jgi:hypothetical protein
MPLENIYETVTVIFSGTDFQCHCFNSCLNLIFILSPVYPPPPQKKDKEYDVKNGFYFFFEYLVSEGGNMLPKK